MPAVSLKTQRQQQKLAKQLKQIAKTTKKTAHKTLPQSWVNNGKTKQNRGLMFSTERYGAVASESERDRVWYENQIAWQELVYCQNLHEKIGQFEKMLRNAMVLFSLFDDDGSSWFLDVFKAAEVALREECNSRDLSPNQRRKILKPLQDLNNIVVDGLMYVTPQQTLLSVAKYGTGVQVQAYTLAFWEQGDTATLATFAVMDGQSINDVAKKCGIKVNQLREKILYCARCIYRVAECDTQSIGIAYPTSIPELRGQAWKKWRDGAVLLNAYDYARHQLVLPFEAYTGKGMTDGYDKRFQAIRERIFNKKAIN